MTLKKQFKKLKENWLLALLILLVLLVPLFVNFVSMDSLARGDISYSYGMAETAPMYDSKYYYDEDFSPVSEERFLTKTARLTTEIKRGEFTETTEEIKSLVDIADGFILNEDLSKYGEGRNSYYYGYYTIKVESGKYLDLLEQLKDIGEVQSFSEDMTDITESYLDLENELNAEKERLALYEEMYASATDISDKIELADKIFNVERTISYYEDQLENKQLQVSYSTIYLNLEEERSSYINVVFVKFGDLVESFVDSINQILKLVFWVLPWVILLGIVWFIVKKVRKKF